MWPAGRGQGGKGASRECGVKPRQQVNGCAVRGPMNWRGAEDSQGEARKHPGASAGTSLEVTDVPTMKAAGKRGARSWMYCEYGVRFAEKPDVRVRQKSRLAAGVFWSKQMAGAGSVAEPSEALGEGAWQDGGTVNPVGNICTMAHQRTHQAWAC